MATKKHSWQLASGMWKKLGLPKSTFYDLIKSDKIKGICRTERGIKICEGYFLDDGTLNLCLTPDKHIHIDCRTCSI